MVTVSAVCSKDGPQAYLGFSPFELLFGRHPHRVLDVLWEEEWKEMRRGEVSPLSPM